MGNRDVKIETTGIRELRKALRDTDPELVKEFRREFKAVAEIVAADARSTMPARSGRARGSVRAVSGGNTVYVKGGKATVPYYGWLDFGGVLRPSGRRRGTQFRPVLGDGRYLYPAIRRNRDRLIKAAEATFDRAARKVGL